MSTNNRTPITEYQYYELCGENTALRAEVQRLRYIAVQTVSFSERWTGYSGTLRS